jgi:hypothetical protein
VTGTSGADLARRYRRLLAAYPRRHRREHGEEMLTTLLDAAGPDQTRPSRREALDLLGNGLRRRLMPAHGVLPHLGAALSALVLAAAGIAAGTWLGWRADAPPLPTDEQALTVARQAAPDLTPAGAPDRFAAVFDYEDADSGPPLVDLLVGGDDYRAGWVDVTYRRSPQQVAGDMAAIHDRLAAAGWRTGPVATRPGDQPGVEFRAALHDRVVTVTTDAYNPTISAAEQRWIDGGGQSGAFPDRFVVLSFERAEPAVVRTLGAALGLAGLIVGWVVAARTSRVVRRRRTGVRLAHLFLTALGLTYALVTAAATVLAFVTRPWVGDGVAEPVPYWAFYLLVPTAWLNDVAVLALVAGGVLLAVRRWRTGPAVLAGAGGTGTRPDPTVATAVAVAAALCLPVVAVALMAVATLGGSLIG